MDVRTTLLAMLEPGRLLMRQGLQPDPWQQAFLQLQHGRVLLCCTRGGGKSRATSIKALHRALYRPGSQILLVSRSLRQSSELLRYVRQGYQALGLPEKPARATTYLLELANGSRILSLPGNEETIRGLQGIHLLIIDEAARVPDVLYHSVRPMLGVSQGHLIALSTPFGQRGWFWRAWTETGNDWHKIRVPWTACPRLDAEFIEQERRACGSGWVAQEYECSFQSMAGLVYPDLREQCAGVLPPGKSGHRVGGIDFGFRNPFAAVWGLVDGDDVLWLTHEYYRTGQSIQELLPALPVEVTWYADPSSPQEIRTLVRAGLTVRRGHNAIAAGIAAVRARIETGRLRIDPERCANLLREATLYHYPAEQLDEIPVDADNHALSALRYLVSRLDASFLSGYRRVLQPEPRVVPSRYDPRDVGWTMWR